MEEKKSGEASTVGSRNQPGGGEGNTGVFAVGCSIPDTHHHQLHVCSCLNLVGGKGRVNSGKVNQTGGSDKWSVLSVGTWIAHVQKNLEKKNRKQLPARRKLGYH